MIRMAASKPHEEPITAEIPTAAADDKKRIAQETTAQINSQRGSGTPAYTNTNFPAGTHPSGASHPNSFGTHR